jgi:hypothetical protein
VYPHEVNIMQGLRASGKKYYVITSQATSKSVTFMFYLTVGSVGLVPAAFLY